MIYLFTFLQGQLLAVRLVVPLALPQKLNRSSDDTKGAGVTGRLLNRQVNLGQPLVLNYRETLKQKLLPKIVS